jgi:hypothetical protein
MLIINLKNKNKNDFKKCVDIEVSVRARLKEVEFENSDLAHALQNLQPDSILFSETISSGQSTVVGGGGIAGGGVAFASAMDEEEDDAEKSFRITLFENREKTKLVNIFSKNSNVRNNSYNKVLNGLKSNGYGWPYDIYNINLESFKDEEHDEDDSQPIVKHVLLTWKSSYFIMFTDDFLFLVDPKLKLKVLLKQSFATYSSSLSTGKSSPTVTILNNSVVYGTDSFVSLKQDGSLCYISVEHNIVNESKTSSYQFKIIASDKKGIDLFQMNSTKLVCKDSNQKILVYDLNEIKANDYIPKAVIFQFDNVIERFYLWNNSTYNKNKYKLSQCYYFIVKSYLVEIGKKTTELLTLLCINDQITIRKVAEIPLLSKNEDEQQSKQINQIIFNEKFLLIFFKSNQDVQERQVIYSLIILDKFNNSYLKDQLALVENTKPVSASNFAHDLNYLDSSASTMLLRNYIENKSNTSKKSKRIQMQKIYENIVKSNRFLMKKSKIDRETFQGANFNYLMCGS